MIEIFFFLPIFFSAYGIGNKLFTLFKVKSTDTENFIFSCVLGFAFYMYLTFSLGMLHLLYAWAFLLVIIFGLVFSHKECITLICKTRDSIQTFRLKRDLDTALIIVIFISCVLALLSALVLPFLWDELDYQLALPKIWARHHELLPIFSRWISELPSNISMLYIIGIVLKNGILSKLFSLTFGLLLALAIYSFGQRFYDKKTALISTSIYMTLPMVMNHIGSAYIDIPVALLVFLALYGFFMWQNSNDQKWVYVSAIMTGLSIASKHTALFPAAILGAFFVYYLFKKNKTGKAVQLILIFGIIALLFVSPWLLKSYVRTGNPVWPLAYDIFGGEYWDNNLASEYSKRLSLSNEEGLFTFAILPWTITMDSSSFTILLGWNALFLSFVPLLFFYKKIERTTLLLLLHSLLFLYVISFASYYLFGLRILRYIMIYPALSLISATVITNLYSVKPIRKLIMALLFTTFLFTFALWVGTFSQKMPYVFGMENEEEYYSKLIDFNGYPVFQYLNQNTPKDSVIFLFRESRGYFSERDYIVGLPSDQKIVDYSQIGDEEDFYRQLIQNKVTHILINANIEMYKPQQIVRRRQEPFSQKHQAIMDEMIEKKATLLIENNGIYLYELR